MIPGIVRAASGPSLWTASRGAHPDPDFGAGWDDFDRRMRAYDAARWDGLEAFRREANDRAARLGGHKQFTRGNFLRSLSHQAADLAFHYGVTGHAGSLDGVRRVAGWLEAEARWSAQASQNAWKSDLWTADFSTAMGIAYAWVRDGLSAEERGRWAALLSERGIAPLLAEWVDPRTRIHALDSMGHNWWSVCVGGAALALFAVRDAHPGADAWLQRIADGFVEFFAYPGNVLQNKHRTFGAQGDFIESIGYLDYTLQDLVLLFDLYPAVLGRDLAAEIPVLREIGDYYLASVQPVEGRLQRLNFGDMGSGPDTVGAYNHHPTPVWLWLARRFGRADLLRLVRRTHPRPGTFAEFLLWPETGDPGSFAGAPGDRVFGNTGIAVLRDGAEGGYGDDATVFAIKTGEKWNHNQSDAGSFLLSAQGREFLIDPGTTEYSNPLAHHYFKGPEAHNVVLHDGRGQREELDYLGTKFMGRIAGSLLTPGYRYLLADATGPWEGVYQRFYRHVLWIGDFLVLVDDLMAAHAAPWTQLLHYRGRAETSGGVTRIENGGKTLRIHHLFPAPVRAETREGHASAMLPNPLKYEYRIDPLPYLALHYAGRDRREKIVQVFELPGGAPKTVSKVEAPGLSGVRVEAPDGTWTILCNHDADGRKMHLNSPLSAEGIETDAFLAALHRAPDGRLLSLAVHNGSFVRAGETVLFSSLLKGDARLVYGEGETTLHSAFSAPARVDLAREGRAPLPPLAVGAGPQTVSLKYE